MAIVKGIIQATGGVKGMSFYTVEGSDKVIMRAKGGPSKKRIATGKEFEKFRSHQAEWPACVQFARAVRNAAGDVYRMADFNLSPVWTGMGKRLLKLDTTGEVGKRTLRPGAYKQALEGFSFNRKAPFASVLRVTPACTIDRDNLRGSVTFPRINTASDLSNPHNLPYFRLVISLGTVSDMVFVAEGQGKYAPANDELNGLGVSAASSWLSANDHLLELTLVASFEEKFLQWLTPDITLILSVGVEFGNVGFGGKISPVKRAGSAKIILQSHSD